MSNKHGISAIANEVIGDVQKEAVALITDAENLAKETLREAKEQADQEYQSVLNQANLKIETEKRKIASVTEVEMRNRLLQAKEDLVDAAFEKALTKLKTFAKTKDYQDYLLNSIENNAQKIGQKNLVVQVNTKDKGWLTQDMLDRLSKKLKCKIELSNETENYLGGCKIQTADSKIIYDGTLDNRLQEFKPILRVEVAKKLFGVEV
jgi:V/A-type H+/Na+-transporting ATPase subunit E